MFRGPPRLSAGRIRGSLRAASRLPVAALLAVFALGAARAQVLYPAATWDGWALPWAVRGAQLDGDGYLDVLLPSFKSQALVIARGGPAGFGPPQTFAMGLFKNPVSARAADLDGDGDVDVVAGLHFTGELAWFEGDGSGTLAAPVFQHAGVLVRDLALGDLNGDGLADIALANEGSTQASVILTRPGFGPLPARLVEMGGKQRRVLIADIDLDGLADLITANVSHVGVRLGTGHGTFGPLVLNKVGAPPLDPEIGDLDGDGWPDLITPGWFGELRVLRGTGSAAFAPVAVLPAPPGVLDTALVDLDRDGQLDLLTAGDAFGPEGRSLHVLRGDGAGAFLPPTGVPGPDIVAALDAADVDGDGRLDALVAAYDAPPRFTVLRGDGAGQLASVTRWAPFDFMIPLRFAAGDLDGDGDPDLVASGSANVVARVLVDGATGLPAAVAQVATPIPVNFLVAGEFDGQPGLDVAGATSSPANPGKAVILGNDGSGTLAAGPAATLATSVWQAAAADLDGDGLHELLCVHRITGQIGVLSPLGDGSFAPPVLFAVATDPMALAPADLDGDGDIDLAVASNGPVVKGITLLFGDGQGGFGAPVPTSNTTGTNVFAVDFDDDGVLDLVGRDAAGSWFMKGDGAGTFAAPLFVGSFAPEWVADLDGDGHADLLARLGKTVALRFGDGAGGLVGAARHDLQLSNNSNLIVADLNTDGRPDLLGQSGTEWEIGVLFQLEEAGAWTALPGGSAGRAAGPQLAARGWLLPGAPGALDITGSAPHARGWLSLHVELPEARSLPALAAAPRALLPFVADALGEARVRYRWPAGVPALAVLHVQVFAPTPRSAGRVVPGSRLSAVAP